MHAICNMLGDGLVPSNSKAGYLVRMLARRVCRMKDDLDLGVYHCDSGDWSLFCFSICFKATNCEEKEGERELREEEGYKDVFHNLPRGMG